MALKYKAKSKNERVYSVHELVIGVRELLRQAIGQVTVQGEISDYRDRSSNLVFFQIKDAKSTMLCFAMDWEITTPIEDGMEVQVTGYPALFQKKGSFHFRVSEIRPVGEGALLQSLEKLKAKLKEQGLFDEARKRPLPKFPERVGLITSPDAAAYNDVLRVLQNRWGGIKILFQSTSVQGAGSAQQVVRAINSFKKNDADVVILTRGGGSLEDLQSFNDEAVARAIFASEVPIICGVGHERDWTIADLVSDKRAATPSNAAELIVPDRQEVSFAIDAMLETIDSSWLRQTTDADQQIDSAINSLIQSIQYRSQELKELLSIFDSLGSRLLNQIINQGQLITGQVDNLNNGIQGVINHWQTLLVHKAQMLDNLSPQSTLNRGYSITRFDKKPLKNISALKRGQILETTLAKGKFTSKVTNKFEHEKN
ncbi:exodeoxyribonuclease VII large subunit [Patescibacteria group bacterium]|nr:exodeoxyribonuclease VII large subunit [Patescibacteria group bacterium]